MSAVLYEAPLSEHIEVQQRDSSQACVSVAIFFFFFFICFHMTWMVNYSKNKASLGLKYLQKKNFEKHNKNYK